MKSKGIYLVVALAAFARVVYADPAPPADPAAEQVDHLALASLLVRDGHLERASAVLAGVDASTPGLDLPRFHTLRGLVALELGQPAQAVPSLEAAIAAGQTEPSVYVLLAQARFGAEDHEGAVTALDRAGEAGWAHVALVLLRARAERSRERLEHAWLALREGQRRFPDEAELTRSMVALLVEMGLYHEAAELGRGLLTGPDAGADEHLALAEALRQGGGLDEAVALLEAANLRFSNDIRVRVQLARAWSDRGKPLAAAGIMAEAARVDPARAGDTGELYRRAGQPVRALRENARVTDQVEKMRQRLGLLVELGRFEQAAAMEQRLGRLGLLADDQVRYALAFSLFRTGQHDAAERQLRRIEDAALFAQAAGLRKAIESCRREPLLCE